MSVSLTLVLNMPVYTDLYQAHLVTSIVHMPLITLILSSAQPSVESNPVPGQESILAENYSTW